MTPAPPQRLHHVAYLTRDTARTVAFYTRCLHMRLVGHAQGERDPTTGAPQPHFHTFLEMADGGCVAFFELLGLPEGEERSPAPPWVRHLALRVPDRPSLLRYKAELTASGVAVLGPVDHGSCESIYFHDPNGIQLELTWDRRPLGDEDARAAAAALDAWNRRAGRAG